MRALNRFVEERAPWELAKSDDDGGAAALDETLATLTEGVRALAVLLWTFCRHAPRASSRPSARRATTSASTAPCSAC